MISNSSEGDRTGSELEVQPGNSVASAEGKDPGNKKAENAKPRRKLWSKLVALVILCNFVLVLFNISYVPLRDVYLRYFPRLVEIYDPVKSIEPHPDTHAYLNTVQQLQQQLETTDLRSPQVEILLAELRQRSAGLIDENPFVVSSQFGTFAKLQRRMRQYVSEDSTRTAFLIFWSQDYLKGVGWQNALGFFEQRIAPLLQVNYYRNVDENGQFLDEFWRIDLYFVIFFGLEFLGRTLYLSRRHQGSSWGDMILRRWYDWFLFLPFWRWLRIIPTTVRLHRSRLVNTERILAQLTHEPAAYLADRVSVFLLVRFINQAKDSIRQGDLSRALFESEGYIQVSDVDKLDAISDRLLELTIFKVLPKIQPEVESFLRYSLKGAFQESDVYRGVERFPGLQNLPADVVEQVADYLAQATYDIVKTSYSDLEGRQLFNQLSQEFRQAFKQELQEHSTQQELQIWLLDLLEEWKLNYVQKSARYDPESILSEADQLYQAAEESTVNMEDVNG
jgi:hypothetical protein